MNKHGLKMVLHEFRELTPIEIKFVKISAIRVKENPYPSVSIRG